MNYMSDEKYLHLQSLPLDWEVVNETEAVLLKKSKELADDIVQYTDIVFNGGGSTNAQYFGSAAGSNYDTTNLSPINVNEIIHLVANEAQNLIGVGGIYATNVRDWLTNVNTSSWTSTYGSDVVKDATTNGATSISSTSPVNHIVDYNLKEANVQQSGYREYERAVFDIYHPQELSEQIPSEKEIAVANAEQKRQKELFTQEKVKQSKISSNDANISVGRNHVRKREIEKRAVANTSERMQRERWKEIQLEPTVFDPKLVTSKTLEPRDHFRTIRDESGNEIPNMPLQAVKNETGLKEGEHYATITDHMHYDRNQYASPAGSDEAAKTGFQSNGMRRFQGSSTPLYTEEELVKKDIFGLEDGLYKHEQKHAGGARPLSVLDPFFRPNQTWYPQYSTFYAYNRTKLPMADLEWRKGFRHIFITRPECYIMARGNKLSQQCQYDEIFYTAYLRMPHICELLSPSYVTDLPGSPRYKDNFNYLLSNRVMGMSVLGTEIDQMKSMAISTIGASVFPGTTVSNDFGNQLTLNFRDTKNLEVYECFRLWMRYISNIYLGTFASSFNNYQVDNNYNFSGDGDGGATIIDTGSGKIPITNTGHLHPYDRALDYCCTIFDIVTNETGTKVLYWCKYIGAYPMGASPGGLTTNNMNEPIIGEQQCSVRFYYQGKEEYKNRSLVEFNFNAGIVDELGRPSTEPIKQSLPFLLRENYKPPNELPNEYQNMNYLGTAGMWTGRPYIVIGRHANHMRPNDRSGINHTYCPYLRFMQLQDMTANEMNVNIVNDIPETNTIMAISD